MTNLFSDSKGQRRSGLLIPMAALAAIAFGCAEDAQGTSGDDLAVEETTESAQVASAADENGGWPEKCDAVYRLTVDNNGKGAKLKIPAGAEVHPQVFIDAPWGNEEVQAIGFRPITDNKKVLHHWIAYANTGGFAFLTGWAPGQDDTKSGKMPPDVGVYLPKGPRSIRLDMHYFNLQGKTTEEDASGVEVCVSKPRKYASTTFMGFAGIPILPPNKKTDIVGKCKVQLTQPVWLMTHSAHAHQLAYHMKFTHQRGNQITVMHDDEFYFEEQTSQALKDGPLELKNGDIITTVCSFNNTTNRTVTFGENTGNEMCFNFATYYPRNALSCALF